MKHAAFLTSRSLPLALSLAGLAIGAAAHAQDTYNTTSKQLTIPSIQIGSTTYENLVVTVGSIVQMPSGTQPDEIGDFYDTATNELFIADVLVNGTTYYNPVVSIANVVSIGSAAGADTYAGGTLSIPAVQVLGGALYTGVDASIAGGQILSIGGGMPTVSLDTYNPATGVLTVPIAQYNGHYYTNVTASVALANVTQVGGRQELDSIIHPFTAVNSTTGVNADGANPNANLLQDANGNFYGTASYGGTYGYGTVFKLPASGGFQTLYSFTGGDDGGYPYGDLAVDSAGNLYGTTSGGGADGFGTVFKIAAANGAESTVWTFGAAANDGEYANGVMLGTDGNLYGTTTYGGASGFGTVFKVTLVGVSSPTEAPIYSFAGAPADGAFPLATVIQAPSGYLYGTTVNGGSAGAGAIFRTTTAGGETMLYSFTGDGAVSGSNDGALPEAKLVQSSSTLMIFGTTYLGGANDVGTVFSFDPTTLTETPLHSFEGSGAVPGSIDGAYPYYGLVLGSDGNLYGTTPYGGAYNEGTVFQMSVLGVETLLYAFNGDDALAGSNDGAYPNGLIQAANGALYGTAYNGGSADNGLVFEIAP